MDHQQLPPTPADIAKPARGYAEVGDALRQLMSPPERAAAWQAARRQDKAVSLLEEMTDSLAHLNLDVKRLSCVHVAGTKGKGSTCAFVESILRRGYGLRTGLFTSPNLVHVRERIRIDGKALEEETFARYFWEVWDCLKSTRSEKHQDMPAYFRFLTVLALKVFIEEKVDVAVIEVGVGGRTDATNVVHPVVCGISSLGYDHQDVLGDTLTQIAFEKGGIFKEGVPAYTAPQGDEAMESLLERAKAKHTTLVVAPLFEMWHRDQPAVKLGLAGEFQKGNASLAVALCREWLQRNVDKIQQEVCADDRLFLSSTPASCASRLPQGFVTGLEQCRWPGRAQVIRYQPSTGGETGSTGDGDELWLYLDGAHTEESVEACAHWFAGVCSTAGDAHEHVEERRVLVFNCNQNRSAAKLLAKLTTITAANRSGGQLPAQGAPFDAAVFSTFVTRPGGPDGRSSSAGPVEERTKWQRANAQVYRSLAKQHSSLDGDCGSDLLTAVVVDSIPAALDAVTHQHDQWRHQAAPCETRVRTRVLVTGSLYLVGGVLEVLLSRNALPASALHL